MKNSVYHEEITGGSKWDFIRIRLLGNSVIMSHVPFSRKDIATAIMIKLLSYREHLSVDMGEI